MPLTFNLKCHVKMNNMHFYMISLRHSSFSQVQMQASDIYQILIEISGLSLT